MIHHRRLEIALRSHDEASRRYAASKFVDDSGGLLLWIIGLAIVYFDLSSRPIDDAAVLLMLGSVWERLRLFWRVKRNVWLSGQHFPRARVRVPINVEFAIHRCATKVRHEI